MKLFLLAVVAAAIAAPANAVHGASPPPCVKAGNCPTCSRITNQTECLAAGHVSHGKEETPFCVWNSTFRNKHTPGCSNCAPVLPRRPIMRLPGFILAFRALCFCVAWSLPAVPFPFGPCSPLPSPNQGLNGVPSLLLPGTSALGMAMAKAWCTHICPQAGPDPVLIRSCDKKDLKCTTSGKSGGPSGAYQWRCYNPASLNGNHTAYVGGGGYCSRNEEIEDMIESCKCNKQDRSSHPCGPV
eukprot:COSAG01_NODE_1073_length_11862_cov_11.086117_3_plen_242_part_00